MPEEEEKQSALRLAGGAQQLGATACDESVTLTASYDITSLSASLSLHAGRCHCMLAVYLAASTTLSTSLSLHAGRLRRPARVFELKTQGPDPSGVKPFSSTCVPGSLKTTSIFYVTLPAALLVGYLGCKGHASW